MKRGVTEMNGTERRKDITIRFPRRLCSGTFKGKDGSDYTRIVIPERRGGKEQSFDLPTKSIHAEQGGTQFLFATIEGNGMTRIHNLSLVREDAGRGYVPRDGFVPNPMLRAMVETNSEVIQARDERASILAFLHSTQTAAPSYQKRERVKTAQPER